MSSVQASPGSPALARNDLNRNPYSARELLRRALWDSAQATLFRWSPRPLRAWRRFLLRLFGARVGRGVSIHPTVRVEMPWNVSLGDFSAVGRGAWIYSVGRVDIGAHATVSALCVLCAASHDLDDPATPLLREPVVVEEAAWLGMGVFIGPGVALGRGCVIGAKSAVFKDMPPETICHGHPCEPRRPRGA